MSKTVRLLTDVKLFMRFEYMTFAAILPLIGASSVSARLSGRQILGLIAAAVSFHIYVSLLNDVADLSLDRIDPRRADYPLVRGAVLPSQALSVAFVQIPIAVALTMWLDGPGWAYAALALGIGLMTVYDLLGKRLRFPPFQEPLHDEKRCLLAYYMNVGGHGAQPVTVLQRGGDVASAPPSLPRRDAEQGPLSGQPCVQRPGALSARAAGRCFLPGVPALAWTPPPDPHVSARG